MDERIEKLRGMADAIDWSRMPSIELCPDCSHLPHGHDRRAEDGICDECHLAKLGQYAPCSVPIRKE